MSDDLINRLRNPHSVDTWHAAQEAAEEITALRAEGDELREVVDHQAKVIANFKDITIGSLREMAGKIAAQETE